MGTSKKHLPLNRCAGVLLHPTSFPGPLGQGDIGHQAYRFIEFLHGHGFKVWQMLPLGVTHSEKSPYQCLSSHAGNPLLISLDWLQDKAWLDKDEIDTNDTDDQYRLECLQYAAQKFDQQKDKNWQKQLQDFYQQHRHWLDDYALFMVLKKQYEFQPWYEWPEPVRQYQADAIEKIKEDSADALKQYIFEQFIFFTQWSEIRDYAKQHDVQIFGDLPIFVAKDSADVWAQRDNFLIDENGDMEWVSGVPPDAFSATGQRWGNPLYDWNFMQQDGFNWWKKRFQTQQALFDIVRIDHFRGLQAYWRIPEQDDTAINGEWIEVPGDKLLDALLNKFENLSVVAEDLGVITDEVIKLKNQYTLPGMKVLQFAFDGNPHNTHLPHCHETNDVIYTGTHDNDTSVGWLNNIHNYDQNYLQSYLGCNAEPSESMALRLIRLAMSSVSFMCIIPMQDLLLLDSNARMNIPGTVDDNWTWRFEWNELKPDVTEKISHMLKTYQR